MLASSIHPEILRELINKYPNVMDHLGHLKPEIYQDRATDSCVSGSNQVEGMPGGGVTEEVPSQCAGKEWQKSNKGI